MTCQHPGWVIRATRPLNSWRLPSETNTEKLNAGRFPLPFFDGRNVEMRWLGESEAEVWGQLDRTFLLFVTTASVGHSSLGAGRTPFKERKRHKEGREKKKEMNAQEEEDEGKTRRRLCVFVYCRSAAFIRARKSMKIRARSRHGVRLSSQWSDKSDRIKGASYGSKVYKEIQQK